MSRIGGIGAVVTTLALVAGPLAAQGGRGPARGPGMMGGGPGAMARNPVEVVLEHRADLDLAEEQVRTLEALRERVDEENGPRWEQLREAFGDGDLRSMSAEEREEVRERMRALQPVREEIRATNRSAMDQVHELLTDAQESRLHGIMRRERRPGRRPHPGAGPGRKGVDPDGGGVRPDGGF